MRKQPEAPRNLRNGLKWRDGRPRWEPSPKNREIGLKGRDLKRPDGEWMDRGEALSAADARHLWASYIRDAHQPGPAGDDARRDLRAALSQLGAGGAAGAIVGDLIDKARQLLQDETRADAPIGWAPKSVAAMVDAYFTALENKEPYFLGEKGELKLSAATIKAYEAASRRLVAKFGDRLPAELTRGEMRGWYDQLKSERSLSVANLQLGCAAAFFRWATLQTPPWLKESPCLKLRREKPEGRRVFWEPEEEQTFVAFCDAHGFVDIADAAVFGIWTGARIFDLCRANLEELRGDTWRYRPHKTARRSKREALPGLAPHLKLRIERRWREAAASKVTQADGRPFLWDLGRQARFTTETLRDRFKEAKAAALAADAVPQSLLEKRGGDWRDTCITRLWEAEVGFDRIPSWTGHSPDEAGTILRDHYIALRDRHAMDTLAKLTAYMQRQGVSPGA
jgi:hypothetical protein